MRFPEILVSGTYEDIGRAIGKKMGVQIRKVIEKLQNESQDYPNLLAESRKYYLITQEIFPHLMVEMEAIVEGAGINKADYFLANNREVYDESELWDKKDAVVPDHCTIAASFNESGVIVGHNEDWVVEVMDEMYILKAKLGNTTYLGLNYALAVPGVAASMNSWGLVQCINDLHQISVMGVPKNFLARAVLECKTLDEAEKLIRNTPKASGFNHVLAQGREVRNFEIAGNKVAVQRIVNGTYVHTNHYLTPEMKSMEEFHTKSSDARYKRAKELIKPNMTKTDMMVLLSDTEYNMYPICREKETVGSLIFQTQKGQVDICNGHPCGGEFISYNI